jgi:ElaB/YqjD/DUF883 family membrane-anchored ribosome-binding protein
MSANTTLSISERIAALNGMATELTTTVVTITALKDDSSDAEKVVAYTLDAAGLLERTLDINAVTGEKHRIAAEIFIANNQEIVKEEWRIIYKKFVATANGWGLNKDADPITVEKQKELNLAAFKAFNGFQEFFARCFDFEGQTLRTAEEIKKINKDKNSRNNVQAGTVKGLKETHAAELKELNDHHEKTLKAGQKAAKQAMDEGQENAKKALADKDLIIEQLREQLATAKTDIIAAKAGNTLDASNVADYLTEQVVFLKDSSIKGKMKIAKACSEVSEFLSPK